MTEPLNDLHDLLTRIADQAGPGRADAAGLWEQARQARRERRRRRAAALVAAGLAAVATLTAVGMQVDRDRDQSPVERPDQRRSTGPGIPSVVHGVPGDGGLELETDLAVGPVSVAIANPTGAYVVTAEDGVYHRIRLPGYDAASYDDELPGVALSPDGTRLAYGWRSGALHADGRPLRAGLRVLDLTTASVWSMHFGAAFDVSGLNVYPWDLRWSPDGRYLGASVAIHEVGGMEHWYAVLEPSKGRVLEEIWHAKQWPDPPLPVMVSSGRRVAAMETDPRERLATWDGEQWRTLSLDATGLSTGRWSPDGQWLAMAGDGLRSDVALLDAGGADPVAAATAALPQRRYPYGAAVDLLAWTGERQVLALLRPGVGPTTIGPDSDLALLTMAPGFTETGDVGLDVEVVGRVSVGETQSTFSFATDLVTAESPTRDFDAPPFARPAWHDRAGDEQPG